MAKRFLRRPELSERYGIGRSTTYDYIARGLLPKPTYLGTTPLWSVADLDAWDEARLSNSRARG